MRKYPIRLIAAGLLLLSSFAFGAAKVQKTQPNPPKTPVVQRDSYGYPIQTVSFSEIRQLLFSKQYKKLNTLLDGYQKEFDQDYRNEYKLFDAYDTFSAQMAGSKPLLDEWVRQFPNAYQPYLARAFYLSEMGWEYRGFKWSIDTFNPQFEGKERFFDAARRDLETVFRIEPKAIGGYRCLIAMNMGARKRGENQVLIGEALKRFPASFMLRVTYLEALTPRWGGSYEEMDAFAVQALESIKLNPRLVMLKGLPYIEQAETAWMVKDYAVAVSAYQRALIFGETWEPYYGQALCSYDQKNMAGALTLIDNAVALNPQSNSCYLLRARIHYGLGHYEQSLKDIEKSESIVPGYPETAEVRKWLVKSLVFDGYEKHKSKKYDQAISLFTWAVKMKPDHAEAFYWRGQSYCCKRLLASAQYDFEQTIAINPRYFNAYLSIAWVLGQAKGWDRVVDYWNKYIALEPNDGRAYRARCEALSQKGDLKAALADAQKAAELGDAEGRKQYEHLKSIGK